MPRLNDCSTSDVILDEEMKDYIARLMLNLIHDSTILSWLRRSIHGDAGAKSENNENN